MARHQIQYDDVKQKVVRGNPLDEDFDVGAGGVAFVTLATALTASSFIDVWVNGQLVREGASRDWTRDTGNNKILFNNTIPQNAWIRVRFWHGA